MQRIIYILLLATALFSSCLLEEDDLFNESAAERKQTAINKFSGILESAPNGWLFEYYPHSSQAYGGWNYLVKFAGGDTVYAAFEYVRDPEIVQSLHEVIYDYGAMLTFNTYNEHLHYFAEARNTSTLYQGLHGDYEFMLMEYDESTSTLKLKGKKTTNYMTMTKLANDVKWTEYLDAVNDTEAQWLFADYILYIDGKEASTVIKTGKILTFTWAEEDKDVSAKGSLIYRPGGNIHFYEPVEVAGIRLQGFKYDSQTNTATALEYPNVVLKPVVADDFVYYDEFLGNWTLTDYSGNTYTVTFAQDVRNKSFVMTSGAFDYTVYWNWSSSNSGKRLTLYCQVLKITPEENAVLLMPAYITDTGTSFYSQIGSAAAYFTFDGVSTISCTGGTSATITGFIFFIRNSTNTANVGWAPSPNVFINATLTR